MIAARLQNHHCPTVQLEDDHGLHLELTRYNAERLTPRGPDAAWQAWRNREERMLEKEHAFVERERHRAQELAPHVPDDPEGFAQWFSALAAVGPGQGDHLFPWLAHQADLPSMIWFLTQEAAGEAGFDDLVAMSQVKLPSRPKLEMARNYWDEMGRGQQMGMHSHLLDRLVRFLDLKSEVETTLWQPLALSNLMIALAIDRQYAYHAVGALGVIELTAPGRVGMVNEGLKRLGVPASERRYFELHASLDIKHAQAWIEEVIKPLVAADPAYAQWIAEGALMRLSAGERCFYAYRTALDGRMNG